ncbi:Interferon- developmental regulator 1 [Spiromyces aspiralis]|uniref:Interferon- developmental regulator 1 n=1 Tax=Spiromyces aspiralis TaxID=68401 RepID=A0ACC1HSV7_9FUNG|nr:Interferon- developmental regulator 1 [Spiromyces aspiralis]
MVIQQMLTSLGFLMTLIAQTHPSLVGDLFKPSIDKHLALLGTDSFGIRMTAAQNIAFVYDVMTRINPRFEFAKHDQLISTLHLMIREGAKRVKHKERKHQRGIIRDVLNTIEEGDPPSLKLKFKNQIITFGDWTQILRLYAFRDTLSTGFHAHFMDNPLLPAIFNVDIGSAGSGSIQPNVTERVVVDPGSELAKARTKVMQSRRDKRRVARDIIDPLHDDEY